MHKPKKPRTVDNTSIIAIPGSKPSNVFAPFRALGMVSTSVPAVLQTLGTDNFLTTCIGHAFHVYNVDSFRLMSVSSSLAHPISCLASLKEFTFVGSGPSVYVFARGKQTTQLTNTEAHGSIIQLIVLGEYLLGLSDDNKVSIWDHKARQVYSTLLLNPNSMATCFMHPHTYLNKIVIGTSLGTMQLWNVKTNQIIYEFESVRASITCMIQSPVIDVIAIGTSDGHIYLHNLKQDDRVGQFQQQGRVTALAFRDIESDPLPILVSANHQGDIAVWDLNKRRLIHNLTSAHENGIGSTSFVPGKSILVTSGADNAIKQFIFDSPNGVPRLLKFRTGHASPPTTVRFYDEESKFLLTTARDSSVRLFSVVRDANSCEFSQGKGTGVAANTGLNVTKGAKRLGISVDQLKLPPVTCMSMCETTQLDWDNIITAHENTPHAQLWSFHRKALGNHAPSSRDKSVVKSVAMTPCGNFCVLGTERGNLDVYNVQSGQFRRSMTGAQRHTKPVLGIVVDRINRYVISASLDKSVIVWDFRTGLFVYRILLPAAVTRLVIHMDNELVAMVCDDLVIRVVDLETRAIVREFVGHRHRITDLCFSPDGRWLVSTSLDASIRTWDLPTGYLIDQFCVDQIVTSVTFSKLGDYLATTHVDNLAVCLWSNRSQYTNMSLKPISADDELLEQRVPTFMGSDDELGAQCEVVVGEDINYTEYTTADQIDAELVTISTYPKSRWQTLIHLDTVRARNKPIEPPRVKESAPFFLPTVPGLVTTFDASAKGQDKENAPDLSRTFQNMSFDSEFVKLLRQCSEEGNYDALRTMVLEMSPSSIDVEIRMLPEVLKPAFIQFLVAQLERRSEYELGQAWMHVFLKVHGESITRNPECQTQLGVLLDVHKREWVRVQAKLRYCNSILDFVRY